MINGLITNKLGRITKLISSGATPRGGSKTYLSQGPVIFLRSQNIQMGHIDLSTVAYISEEADKALKRTRVENGDVLLNITGASIGRVAPFCLSNKKANVNQHVCVIRPISQLLHSRYLARYLSTPQFQSKIDQLQNGGTRQALTFSKIADFDIPVPPIKEQKRIAAILDKADAIIRKRQQAIKLADDFLRATFLDMFGDPVTNPKGWEVKPVGELLTFLTSGSRGWAKYYSNDGTLFLRIQNVGKNELILKDVAFVNSPESAEARRTRVQPGDVLLSITADLGRTAVIPKEFPAAHINQHLAILRFHGVDPIYASAFLASSGGQRQIQRLNREGVKAGLNFDNVRSLKMILPPESLQNKWVKIYKKKLKQNRFLNNAKVLDHQLFSSLSQHAFRGEL